ncbi:MAG: photosynthetic complex assembly protein PuhC [Pseudomonadota bacterium]
MTAHTHQNQITGVHKLPLYGALAVVIFSVAAIAISSWTGQGRVGRTIGTPVAQRDIMFRNDASGTVQVLDAQTRAQVATFDVGEGAFLRAAIRSMSLNRSSQGVDYTLPYTVSQSADGKLAVIDPATGHSISLNAFGRVAIESFAKILPNSPKNRR